MSIQVEVPLLLEPWSLSDNAGKCTHSLDGWVWYSQGIGSNERRSLDDQIELAPGHGASFQSSMVNPASSFQEFISPPKLIISWKVLVPGQLRKWAWFLFDLDFTCIYIATCYLLIQSSFNPSWYRFSLWCCPTRLSTLQCQGSVWKCGISSTNVSRRRDISQNIEVWKVIITTGIPRVKDEGVLYHFLFQTLL